MSRKKTFLLLTVFGLICLSIGFVGGFFSYTPVVTWSLEKQQRNRQNRLLHKPAPSIATHTVDGKTWSLLDCRGKVVLINFWAVWCGPCVQEVPELKEFYSKYKDRTDVIMVGVSLDREKAVLTSFCKERGIEWLQLHEDGRDWDNTLAQAFDVQFLPSMWLIDREGNIVAFETSLSDLEARLVQSLALRS